MFCMEKDRERLDGGGGEGSGGELLWLIWKCYVFSLTMPDDERGRGVFNHTNPSPLTTSIHTLSLSLHTQAREQPYSLVPARLGVGWS